MNYEKWADLLEDPGWSYKNVLPYFKKSENFTKTNPYAPIDQDYHGYDGPLHMTQSVPPQDMSRTIHRGSQQLGYAINDYNGREQMGASILQTFTKDGRRYDAEMAFISPARTRKNLVVLDNSYVIKIDICPKTKRVKGVIFTRENKTYIARNRKEVILSAGTISSPQILMLSGIGPQDQLECLGIPVIRNLPVGKTLRERTMTTLVFSSNVTCTESIEKSVKDFLNRQGFLTRPSTFDAVGWFKTQDQDGNYPNIEYLFNNISGADTAKRFFGWSDETFNALTVNVHNLFAIFLFPLNTKSIGTVKLKSADPFDYPVIDSNILSDNENRDIERIYQGIRLALKLIETDAFRSMNIKLAFTQFPGCTHTKPLSKEYWYCYVRRVTGISSHPVSTCLAGRTSDTGVVDRRLKVFGIKGLRVADASIIPVIVSGHTNAVCTMVGEKASDIIKKDNMY